MVINNKQLDNTNYDKYAEKCIEELKPLQDKLFKDYDINSYENWFYNQVTGLLTFSTGDNKLNFRYISIGSFSEKTQTWKWSWDNEHTLDNVKIRSEVIKEFGIKNNFTKLTTGYLESSEIEAWEFVAIGAKLCGGIGAYRPVSDNYLKIFLVITEHVDNVTAERIKDKYVKCNEHEYRRRAFVCHHLNTVEKVGFEEAFETFENMELGEEDDFQAWCNDCEIIRQQEDGWNETSMKFADIKLVCEACYFKMKETNLGHR